LTSAKEQEKEQEEGLLTSYPEDLINVKKLRKGFEIAMEGTLVVLDEVSFKVPKGKVVSLLGPNGCGKSTILNILARILLPDSGSIEANGPIPLSSMKVSYLMQNSTESLFPWKAAWDNIAFPLELKGKSRAERREKAGKLVNDLGLENILTNLQQYTYQLSGGQKQACNIARAIMHEPELMLMDEPFAALDYETKLSMTDKLCAIFHKRHLTSVLVSHDIEEAIQLSDLVVILSAKPTHVIKVISVPFEHPRDHTLLNTFEFFELRNRILELFSEGIRN
jgi:NitT/TauT family transport system ATP-binding protein